MKNKYFWTVFSLTIIIGMLYFIITFILSGKNLETFSDFGPLETIHGIPFSVEDGSVKITDEMAHLRIPYYKTKFGKELKIEIAYELSNTDTLQVGLRKGDFWLDYQRVQAQKEISFNLSSAYQNSDGSFDLMFFAKNADGSPPSYEIKSIKASIVPSWSSLNVSVSTIKSEIKSIIFRK